ncbi:MAG: hypothetical protein ACKV2U_04045 [Bryobacteraceae bacterium]
MAAKSFPRAIIIIFVSAIRGKDFMKYPIALLISLAALSQVIDPNAKPKAGYKLEMKQGPLAPGPAVVIEKEPGDSVVVHPDRSIVAAARSNSFIFQWLIVWSRSVRVRDI